MKDKWKKGKRNREVREGLQDKKREHDVDFVTNQRAIPDFSKYLWVFKERFFFSSTSAKMSLWEIVLYQARVVQSLLNSPSANV